MLIAEVVAANEYKVTIMTLTQLRYLVAIADAGMNITQAAERVYATQPGLSKQLRQLEDELGMQMFSRSGRSLEAVTPAGALVIERARKIIDEAESIRALAANMRHESTGELRIATTHTQARFVLPPAIALLKEEFPDVNIHLMPGGDAELLELLHRDDIDLAIMSGTSKPPPNFVAVPIFDWERIIMMPNSHPLTAIGDDITLEQLAEYPLVSYESALSPESSLRRAFAAKDLTPRIACTARDADLIKTYVRAGLGVGILAEMAILPEDKADLELRCIDNLLPTCTTWVLVRPDRLLRDFSLAFISALAPQLERRKLPRMLDPDEPDGFPEPMHWRDMRASNYCTESAEAASE